MKPYIYIVFIQLLIVFGTACKHKDTAISFLLTAENLLPQYPDSALGILETQAHTIQKESEAIRTQFSILQTKANEACNIPHVSDSLIRRVLKYYKENGTNSQMAEAYYYQGCVYRDINNVEYALESFQLAIYLSNTFEHQLLGMAYNQLGNLFTFQKLYYEAMEAYREAAFHAFKDNDSITWGERLKHTAHSFTMLNKPDSALYYYEQALLANPHILQTDIEQKKADLYIQMKNFQKARQALEHNLDAYLTWADYYHGTNQKDSALQYYSYALDKKETNEVQRKAIYQRLSAYAEEQGEIQKAYFYLKMADRIQDTLQNRYEIEMIHQAQLIHTYRNASKKKYEKLTQEIKEESDETLPVWIILTIIPIGVGFVIHRYLRHKKRTVVQQPEINTIHQSSIYQLIKSQAHNPDFKLDDEQWKELQTEIDKNYNHFTARLYATCPKMNETELHVCYLLKLSIAPSDIAHIIVRQVSTVSSIRERLYKKIHGEAGNAKQLDDFILKF